MNRPRPETNRNYEYSDEKADSDPAAAAGVRASGRCTLRAEKMQASLLFSLGLFALWLRCRNGTFRLSGPFAALPGVRFRFRPFLFHRRVFILSLGKMQVNLLLLSAYSHFGFAEDTPPRKKCKRTCFFLSAYSYLCRDRNSAYVVRRKIFSGSGPSDGPGLVAP